MPRRYLIIGMGPAGISAAESIRSQDPAGDILLVSDDPHGYYSRPGLAYYLSGEVPEQMLFPWSEADFRRLDLRRLTARVIRLHPGAHQVELSDGTRLPYDRLLLAAGSLAVRPPLPGIDLDGVVKLDDLDEARQIRKWCRGARAAVVMGGGITALEIVEGLRACQVRTHYLMRGDRYWSNVLDPVESQVVQSRLEEEGVHIHPQTEVEQILGQRGRVAGVETKDGRKIACDLVAVAIGVQPRKELTDGSGLEVDRGVLVGERLETNVPDLFAAGDVAQAFDPLSRRATLNTLWSVAVAQGHVAGLNMAGQTVVYRKAVPLNVTRLAGLVTTVIGTVGGGSDRDVQGIGRGDSETWRHAPQAVGVESKSGANRLRVMVGERTLLGAIVMGDQALSRPLHYLIGQQVDITAVRARLLEAKGRLAEPILGLWGRGRAQDATQP